jgi:hypothetical protein
MADEMLVESFSACYNVFNSTDLFEYVDFHLNIHIDSNHNIDNVDIHIKVNLFLSFLFSKGINIMFILIKMLSFLFSVFHQHDTCLIN